MRLNERELVVAFVAADLLEKGCPEYRIAKYCLRKKMNLSHVAKLSKKLPSFDPHGYVLRWFHHLSERPELPDNAIESGRLLRQEILNYGK